MRLKTIWVFPIVMIILFGGIVVADGFGLWQTESTKEPALISSGEFAGMADPADIRGSYSFGEIESSFNVSPSTLANAFGIEVDKPSAFLVKELEERYGETADGLEIGTGSVRLFVALYTGLPYEGDDGITTNAIEILKKEGKWPEDMNEIFKDRIIDLSVYGVEGMESSLQESATPSEEIIEHDEDEIAVKGKTTVAELISWGISIDKVEEILGVEVPNENLLIKDICTQNGLSFTEIKETLNTMLQ